MGSNIHSIAIVKKGNGDTDENATVTIEFANCYGEVYGTNLTEREVKLFKQGVLSERERVWDRLADILDSQTLDKIKAEELFNC